MIIGVKYWNRGASVPGTWTNVDVTEFESAFERNNYDEVETLDGTIVAFGRERYFARVVFGPLEYNHSTYGPIIAALRASDFCRFNDSRFTWLGTSNTITFIVPSNRPEREEPSEITRGVELSLRAEVLI